MFFSNELLGFKSALGQLWIAGTCGVTKKPFSKQVIVELNIVCLSRAFIHTKQPLALRTAGTMLKGLALLLERQWHFLALEVGDCFLRFRQSRCLIPQSTLRSNAKPCRKKATIMVWEEPSSSEPVSINCNLADISEPLDIPDATQLQAMHTARINDITLPPEDQEVISAPFDSQPIMVFQDNPLFQDAEPLLIPATPPYCIQSRSPEQPQAVSATPDGKNNVYSFDWEANLTVEPAITTAAPNSRPLPLELQRPQTNEQKRESEPYWNDPPQQKAAHKRKFKVTLDLETLGDNGGRRPRSCQVIDDVDPIRKQVPYSSTPFHHMTLVGCRLLDALHLPARRGLSLAAKRVNTGAELPTKKRTRCSLKSEFSYTEPNNDFTPVDAIERRRGATEEIPPDYMLNVDEFEVHGDLAQDPPLSSRSSLAPVEQLLAPPSARGSVASIFARGSIDSNSLLGDPLDQLHMPQDSGLDSQAVISFVGYTRECARCTADLGMPHVPTEGDYDVQTFEVRQYIEQCLERSTGREETRQSISFRQIAPPAATSRSAAANAFSQILILASHGDIIVLQEQPFCDIEIMKGIDLFDNGMPASCTSSNEANRPSSSCASELRAYSANHQANYVSPIRAHV